jgi:very-short-patch-repair endonuclease
MFSTHPKAQYWHPTKNGDLTPDMILCGSGKKRWFTCECGHDFETVIQTITKTNVWCPYCSIPSKKLCENNEDGHCLSCFQKSFASHEMASYLDIDKNKIHPSTIYRGANIKCWFTCDCGHSIEKTINKIVDHSLGCPYCCVPSKKLCEQNEDGHCQSCFQKSFASHEKAQYWDIDKNKIHPSAVCRGSSSIKYWFHCECGHTFNADVGHITSKDNTWCPYCSDAPKLICENNEDGHCPSCFQKSFASHEKATYWDIDKNKIHPSAVYKGANTKYWFTCDCGHSFDSLLSNVTTSHRWCPYCSIPTKKLCEQNEDGHCPSCFQRSFASHERVTYWDIDKNKIHPSAVYKSANTKYWFICTQGHSFHSCINNINSSNTWCPYCINKTEQKLYESMIRIYPTLQRQYKVEWCKSKTYLPFDFVLEKEKIIIELDGPQHFQQISNWSSPESQLQNDTYKMRCANDNGFSVIRITQNDVFHDRFDWVTELHHTIQELLENKTAVNVFLYMNDEYDKFD